MPIRSVKQLVAEANGATEQIFLVEAVQLMGRLDVVFIDVCE